MKTIAIIAEYNPFHNGHLYHLNQSKKLTDADYCIALMSGNFLQRGVPAMWDKYTRGYMCTSNGIDLALELPVPYATGSALDFAMGAIHILNSLNVVDYLCFGAETEDIELLTKISQIIVLEPEDYKNKLKDFLSQGLSYPTARQKSLTNYFNAPELTHIISQPNNILAIEYISALIRTKSAIKPILIKRKQAMYHDTQLYGSISSATAIRNTLQSETHINPLDAVSKDLPDKVASIIDKGYSKNSPIYTDDLTPFLQSKLLFSHGYDYICDISKDLSNKLTALSPDISFSSAIDHLTTKDMTKTRISRSLIHLILGYSKTMRDNLIANNYALYANILSFKKDSSSLIKEINKNSVIPLITKKADFSTYLSNYENLNHTLAHELWNLDTDATNLYNCLIYNRYSSHQKNDFTIKIPIS